MPQAVGQHNTRTPRRPLAAAPGTSRRRRRPLTRAEMRASLEAAVAAALSLLDAMDGDPDMEADHDGEAEVDEGSAQPITLSPDRRPVVVHRPNARQMRGADRGNGDPISANLRGLLGRAFA